MESQLIIYNEERLDKMEEEIHEGITVYPATENPSDLAEEASVGISEKYAREDHVHKLPDISVDLKFPMILYNDDKRIMKVSNGKIYENAVSEKNSSFYFKFPPINEEATNNLYMYSFTCICDYHGSNRFYSKNTVIFDTNSSVIMCVNTGGNTPYKVQYATRSTTNIQYIKVNMIGDNDMIYNRMVSLDELYARKYFNATTIDDLISVNWSLTSMGTLTDIPIITQTFPKDSVYTSTNSNITEMKKLYPVGTWEYIGKLTTTADGTASATPIYCFNRTQ
jgi:hypothetical protein